MFKWTKGRQGSGYDKLKIMESRFPLPFDIYLIRYPVGSYIGPHTDPVTGRKHYRCNIVLKASAAGGVFNCASPIFESERIKIFRPDKSEHSVTPVLGSPRYVLSIGWLWGKE